MKIKDILTVVEQLAPRPLQESWDNSGIQIGDTEQEVKSVLLCIDVTEAVVDEAIRLGCNLIIAHHPIAFKPFRSLTGKNYIERCMIKACKNDLVLYAAHTNLDNATGGVNFELAEMLGLQDVKILQPQKKALLKFVTYVPLDYTEKVRTALFEAGAGTIGEYDQCSYNIEGKGTFRPGENTDPFCGERGKLHTEKETRIEVILPTFKQIAVLKALIASHPYKVPAYDFYMLENLWEQAGSGTVGMMPQPMAKEDFLKQLKKIFNLSSIQYSNNESITIRKVALCGGSGAFLIPQAIASGADIFITGEAKYNDFYDVEDRIILATIGHYESEVCTKNIFYKLLSQAFPHLSLSLSECDTNPINYI